MLTLLQSSAPALGAGSGQGWSTIVMLVLIFVVMWFFMIRPQRKQQKELQAFREGLKKGDKVVTAGGIYGTVVEIKDTTLLLEVDKDVKICVAKNSVSRDYESAGNSAADTTAKK